MYSLMVKIWTFLINQGSKRVLNLIMDIFGMKYGEKPGKIWINRSDIMQISKWDIFFYHPLDSLIACDGPRLAR